MNYLIVIKTVHTVIWAVFVICIVGAPIAAGFGRFDWSIGLISAVLVECGVLALNKGACPLTSIAARYTGDRAANFDIFLPVGLALHNKAIFGSLFVAGLVFVVWRWLVTR